MRKGFKITTKYIMGVMLFFIMVLSGSVTGRAYSTATQILPATPEQPSAGCMLVGVRGEYIGGTEEALARINAIRKEACEEGVPNPQDPSVKLTMADYKPIQWSAELEEVARIRAAEASLLIGHNRPNGQDCFSLRPLGYNMVAESLAWNGTSSMLSGIKQWYEEKELWNVEKDRNGAGHYVSMINPDYTYVGLGCMVSEYGVYKNTLCGRFGSTKNTVDGTMAAPVKDCIRVIEIKKSSVGNATLKKISGAEEQLKAGDTLSYEFVADTNINVYKAKVLIMDSVVWTSSDENVATVDNYGNVTGTGGGTATITATSASGLSASVSLTFTGDIVEPGDNQESGDNDPGSGNEQGDSTETEGEEVGSGSETGSGGEPGDNQEPGDKPESEDKTKPEQEVETGDNTKPDNKVETGNESDNKVEPESKTSNKVAKVSSLKVKAGRKKLTITWKKMAGATGYELQISTKKNFKGAKTIKLGKNKAKYMAKKLKAKKKYYVRIRAYKTIKNKGKSGKAYGTWVKTNKKTK